MYKKTLDIILIIFMIVLIIACFITYIPKCFAAEIPFTDVSPSDWYYNDVKNAYQTELVDGTTATTFEPESFMTCAQAVKLAACMNQKYMTGYVTLTNGYPDWYSNYIYYAKAFNIIFRDYYWNSNITRSEYAEIFAKALPENALSVKNKIDDNEIPDVSTAHPQYNEIYKLYRAGILTGVDEYGTFHPYDYIKRSEVSAILTRMMNQNARKSFTLRKNNYYYNNNYTTNDNRTVYIVNFNSTGGSPVLEQKVKEGEKAVWPSDPIRDGYRFAGWYIDSHLSKAYNFDSPINNDITLYTKWIRK